MRAELYSPAALLTQAILDAHKGHHIELTTEIIASAFRQAYDAIELAEAEHRKDNPTAGVL